MMKDASTSLAGNLKPGSTIVGKWNNHSYKIIRQLGKGANGVVYLADSKGGRVALKVSDDSLSITSEVNVLKSFSKAQARAMGPSFFDVDDMHVSGGGKKLSFYVMEYIEGPLLLRYIAEKGEEWIPVLISQLLSNLSIIHREGWVFGDLKPENLIVTGSPARIRCIDVGGTTKKGRAIKEYTEFFDRGYWVCGTRKAEPSYDLFSVAMIMINCAVKKEFKKTGNPMSQLLSVIDSHPFLKTYKTVLVSAFKGAYKTADDMKKGLLEAGRPDGSERLRSSRTGYASSVSAPPNSAAQRRPAVSRQQMRSGRKLKRKRRKSGGIFETLLIVVSVLAFYFAYIVLFFM
ncbi:protein kinase domain-containing protein [Bacillus glycinifermentans]|uniref:Protein kinase family protein n=1 Tax=Bacillus glycinifermentans TaxID=1664069 RepID=A0A0T6BS88_9BACI|nr:serine/threonine protein kinase [Bacillus glycinifermentans]KRT94479.1 serine/threonine protein kinase [Bacillus glycinifermentans]MEC0487769.1 protein kinase family protein [Bacillus glycinifermentans]